MVAPTSKEWISLLRLTPLILGSILFFSLIDFGLAVTYAWQLYNAPLDGNKRGDSEDKRWSTASVNLWLQASFHSDHKYHF